MSISEGFAVSNRSYDDFMPELVDWRLLDIDIFNREFPATYTKRLIRRPQPPKGAALLGLLKQLDAMNPKEIQGRDPNWYPTGDETSMSLNVPKRSLVVLTLPKAANLQFNMNGAAFSCQPDHVELFGETGVLTPDGKREVYTAVNQGAKTPGCQTAYFVAESSKGKPVPFNIHLDLVGEGKEGNGFCIPIILDPDVRHPGGSEGP